MQKRSIGIVGGMGPVATLDLFDKLLQHTDAHTDAEHIRVYIDCHTGIPDRTKAILSGGESPVPHIMESVNKLAQMGADFLLIPCNTSHYFYDEIAALSPIPILHMIRETAKALAADGVQRVGLFATDGTVSAGVYQKALAEYGIETICPSADAQREVMRLIYDGVKAGAASFEATAVIAEMARMKQAGAQRIVLGCTELPIGFRMYGIPTDDTVDAADVLAKAAVQQAGYPVK